MEMKRYWVFGFDTYYPSGGMKDLQFSFDTLEEFEKMCETKKVNVYPCDNYHIFDSIEGMVVKEFRGHESLKRWINKKYQVEEVFKIGMKQNHELLKKLAEE